MIDVTKIDEKKVPIDVQDVVKDTFEFCAYSGKKMMENGTSHYEKLVTDATKELVTEPHIRQFALIAEKQPAAALATIEANAYVAGRVVGFHAGYLAAQVDTLRIMVGLEDKREDKC